ncbi:MAG: SusF/SusE family outer membrane protein [Paludibacter sp.]|nr:SusF/SusE family outer membrane protein [Paludibacter sp.]
MKIDFLKRIVITVIALTFISTLFAQPSNVYLIGGPVNKNNPNWLLNQKVELTKDATNPFVFYYKGYLAYNWRGDERGNIKFLIGNDWGGAYHPNAIDNVKLEGTTSMRQDGSDTKWFIPSDRSGDGYYELIFDALAMTLKVDLFRHDLNPEKIYAVGGSLPCGWNNNTPEVMTRTNPTVPIYTWSGIMNSGDFKFLTPLSIGNWDYCYSATTANEPVSFGTAQNVAFEVRNSAETSFNDYKFIMSETAECTITVDLLNNKMTVTKNGQLYAKDIWITGSAIPGGKAKLVGDNIDPLINYHYYGALQQGDFKFATTENVNSTTKFYVPATSSDAVSTGVGVSLTSDATAPGWTVSQAGDLYKVKLNTLTNKYKGWMLGVEHLYIVGGATAVGWDAGNAIELTRGTGAQANVFTFDGNLTVNATGGDPNKFKFLLQKDWGPYSFHAQTENESITGAKYFTDLRSDDYKWTIDSDKQGHYQIKVDVLEETITATYSLSTSVDAAKNASIANIKVQNGKVLVNSETKSSKKIMIFATDGTLVAEKSFLQNVEVELPVGIYIIKVGDGNSHPLVKKISVLK